jgi:hypothetical protein
VPFPGVVAAPDVVETPGLTDGAAAALLGSEDVDAAGAGDLDALGTAVAEAATEGRAEDAVVVLAAAFPQPASARTASAGTMIFLAWPA